MSWDAGDNRLDNGGGALLMPPLNTTISGGCFWAVVVVKEAKEANATSEGKKRGPPKRLPSLKLTNSLSKCSTGLV